MTLREKAFVLNGARIWLRAQLAEVPGKLRELDIFLLCHASQMHVDEDLLEETRREAAALLETLVGEGNLVDSEWQR